MTLKAWNEILLAEKLLTSYLSLYIEKAVEPNCKKDNDNEWHHHLLIQIKYLKKIISSFFELYIQPIT